MNRPAATLLTCGVLALVAGTYLIAGPGAALLVAGVLLIVAGGLNISVGGRDERTRQ